MFATGIPCAAVVLTVMDAYDKLIFLVFVDAWAVVWLLGCGRMFWKLRYAESVLPQAGTSRTPSANEMRLIARAGLKRMGWKSLFVPIALGFWLNQKTHLSAWEMVLAGVSILICFLLIFVMVRLEKMRRLYRPSSQSASAVAH